MPLETKHLPRILMAMSSIIVEWLFRTTVTTSPRSSSASRTTTRDRVMIQVLLWLTVSLHPPFSSSTASNNNNNQKDDASLEILMHAIFGTNLLVIVLAVTDPLATLRYQLSARRRRRGLCLGLYRNMCAVNIHTTSASGGEQTKSGLVSALEKASPSLWLALLWAYITEGPPNSASDKGARTIESAFLPIAAAIFVILNALTYMARIYQAHFVTAQQTSSLPAALTVSNLDEADWRHWTVSDVMAWLHDTSPLAPGDCESVLTRLAWEGVDGPILVEHLDQDALRHMDIPYGPACVLLEHVQTRLKRRYLSSLSREQQQQQQQQQQQWCRADQQQQQQQESSNTFLAQYDQEYQLSLPERRRRQQQEQSLNSWSHHDSAMNKEEVEHVREQILQRWGFSAPEMAGKGNNSTSGANNNDNDTSTADGTTPLAPPDNVVTPKEPETKAKMLDESLLQTMPPHIRDIVQQKPHLWEQVNAMNTGNEEEEARLSHIPQQSITNPQPPQGQLKQPPTPHVGGLERSTPPEEEPQLPLSIIQSLPPHIREVAQRNPQLFQQMLNDKGGQLPHSEPETGMPVIPEESFEEEEVDETEELLPKTNNNNASKGRWLRQRPGF